MAVKAARAAKLTAKERVESARKVVRARWARSVTAGFGANQEPLADARCSERSRDRQGAVAGYRRKPDGQRTRATKTAPSGISTNDTSDQAVLLLLKRLKSTNDREEIRQLSDQLERLIFHKQYANSKAS